MDFKVVKMSWQTMLKGDYEIEEERVNQICKFHLNGVHSKKRMLWIK